MALSGSLSLLELLGVVLFRPSGFACSSSKKESRAKHCPLGCGAGPMPVRPVMKDRRPYKKAAKQLARVPARPNQRLSWLRERRGQALNVLLSGAAAANSLSVLMPHGASGRGLHEAPCDLQDFDALLSTGARRVSSTYACALVVPWWSFPQLEAPFSSASCSGLLQAAHQDPHHQAAQGEGENSNCHSLAGQRSFSWVARDLVVSSEPLWGVRGVSACSLGTLFYRTVNFTARLKIFFLKNTNSMEVVCLNHA